MPYRPITDDDIRPGAPLIGPGGFGEKVKDNFEYFLGGMNLGPLLIVPNGNFEVGETLPVNWEVGASAEAEVKKETEKVLEGSQSWAIITKARDHWGRLTSDFIPYSHIAPTGPPFIYFMGLHYLAFKMFITNGASAKIFLKFYDKNKALIAEREIQVFDTPSDESKNPTNQFFLQFHTHTYVNTRFIKIVLSAVGKSNAGPTSKVIFDDVKIIPTIPSLRRPFFIGAQESERDEWEEKARFPFRFPFWTNVRWRWILSLKCGFVFEENHHPHWNEFPMSHSIVGIQLHPHLVIHQAQGYFCYNYWDPDIAEKGETVLTGIYSVTPLSNPFLEGEFILYMRRPIPRTRSKSILLGGEIYSPHITFIPLDAVI